MRLSAVYRMSEDGVYLSSSPSFLRNSHFVRHVSDPILEFELALCRFRWVRGLVQVFKNGLKEFRIFPKFEVRTRLSGLYRMSENGVYPLSVRSFAFSVTSIRIGSYQIQFCYSSWPFADLDGFVVWYKCSKMD